MRSGFENSGGWQRMRRLTLAMAAVLLTAVQAGCAAPTSYMGIDISKPAPAFTLSPEQAGFFRAQNMLYNQAQAAGCISSKPADEAADAPVGEGIGEANAGQPAVCRAIALRLALLELRRPALVFERSYADMPLTALASEAQGGSKQAQLELGIRFEEGRGVERDIDKARKLYGSAASDSGGTIWVYSPPVGNGTSGRTIPVNTGPKRSGLAEAKRRLEGLE
ncbi:SEL1-like repeat protein [Sphingopyxis sp. BSNA05]|uniref:SEL1-like repeat protein n=1 Tax=Sphingopyxis sp. BSNA05 TaxID=1236614 RepID=UPI0015650786|nr:SEL1-like repeat protein [Sphingopyxis sp. BSNA05]